VSERMTTLPLDTDDLLRGIDQASYEGMAEGTTMGHVHLSVSDVEASVEFYRSLGFDLMAVYGDQAAFLSTGGYHHHLGVNTWTSRGAPYAPDDRARLARVTVLGAPEERELRDPSGIPLALATAG
jgi:catechol 2,3-dioxygenase